MHDIITLQLGSQANHIGTHFWNTQESYFTYGQDQQESPVDHDVHFRPGKAADGSDTYMPRTVIYDFKPNFGTLRVLNELYDTVELNGQDHAAQSLWSGSTMQQRDAPIEVGDYQQSLASGTDPAQMTSDRVRFWSDYNRVFVNPKSVVQIHETELNPGQTAFEDWTAGEELFKSLNREEDLFDQNLRAFVEESDQLQGLQLFASADDGWAGFSTHFMQQTRDELGKLPIWVWASSRSARGVPAITAARRAASQARSLVEVAQQASTYVPLTSIPSRMPSWLSLEQDSSWSTAALQLAALESASLPSRLRRGQAASSSLDEMSAVLDRPGERSIVELAFGASPQDDPASQANGQTNDARRSNGAAARNRPGVTDGHLECDLFPYAAQNRQVASGESVFSDLQCSRGLAAAVDNSSSTSSMSTPAGITAQGRSFRFTCNQAFPMLSSYPQLFTFDPTRQTQLASISMCTKLRTSSRTSEWAKSLATQTQRHLDPEEREEMLNSLAEIADAYKAGYDSDEDWD